MSVMVRLLSFYEMARAKRSKPLGEIFPYKGGVAGLQMLAEFIARISDHNVATMVFPAHGVENLLFIPSGKFHSGFKLEGKITELFEEDHFVMVLQREEHLKSGNYVVLKIMYDRGDIELYHIKDRFLKPLLISKIDLSYLENHVEILDRAFKMVLAEVDTVMKTG